MGKLIRDHRVTAFCDWLDTIQPVPPFHSHPAFQFYADLTQLEMQAASVEMERRANAALAEADALEREGRRNG